MLFDMSSPSCGQVPANLLLGLLERLEQAAAWRVVVVLARHRVELDERGKVLNDVAQK